MEKLNIIASRIKTVRRQLGLTQAQMAEILGISRSTLAGWETAIREPNAVEMVNFCRKFTVTFDYMCGMSNYFTETASAESFEIDWTRLTPEGRKSVYEHYKAALADKQSAYPTKDPCKP